MPLTKHQREIADDVIKSIDTSTKSRRFTCLSGVGGVGKTYTTDEIINELKEKGYSLAVTSTTHQACSVLGEELSSKKIEVTTINKFLQMKPVYESQDLVLKTKSVWEIDIVDVLIIDEYSMLNKIVLDTIEEYANTCNDSLKILLVGDSTQLIMEPKTINSLNIDDNTFWLLEPMRAAKGSELAAYGHSASAAIRNKEKAPIINFDDDGDIVKYTDHKKFIKAWKKAQSELSSDKIKILCFTNAKVRSYNKHIKEDFYKQEDEYAPGNIIVIRNPVELQTETSAATGFHMNIPNNTRLTIEKVDDLEMKLQDGKIETGYVIYPKNYVGCFYIPKSKASLDRYLQPFVDRKDWRNFYKNKNKFAIAHHAESGTVHSSQGSSYDEVFIDASDIMTAQNFRNRLAYVSITRARKKAHVFIGKERDWSSFKNKKTKA